MRISLPKLNISAPYFLKQCGYVEIHNRHKDNETSYARSVHAGRFYPRFHAYIQNDGNQPNFTLHLDAKEPSYAGTSAHGGEYEGPVVENEAARIARMAASPSMKPESKPNQFSLPKRSWWQKLLGL